MQNGQSERTFLKIHGHRFSTRVHDIDKQHLNSHPLSSQCCCYSVTILHNTRYWDQSTVYVIAKIHWCFRRSMTRLVYVCYKILPDFPDCTNIGQQNIGGYVLLAL